MFLSYRVIIQVQRKHNIEQQLELYMMTFRFTFPYNGRMYDGKGILKVIPITDALYSKSN